MLKALEISILIIGWFLFYISFPRWSRAQVPGPHPIMTPLSVNMLGPTQAEYDQLSKDYKTDKYSSLKELLSDDLNSSLIGDDFEIISNDKNNPIIKIFPLTFLGDDKDVIKEIIRLDIITITMFSFTYLNIKSISVIAIPNQLTYEEPGNSTKAGERT